MSHRYFLIAVGVLLLTLPTAAHAQVQQAPTPEKAALIKELIEVVHAQEAAKSIMDSIEQQSEAMEEQVLTRLLADTPGLSEEDRQEALVKARLNREQQDKQFKDLLAQRIDLTKLVEEIISEVYDQYFSEEDLRNLVAFYKSATGQKAIAVMPQLFSESMRKTSERVLPVVQEIAKQIAQEQQKELVTNSKQVAPPARRRPQRRTRKP
jgi:hypothetical protein